MPVAFDKCRAGGGVIRTKRINKSQYMHICIPKGGGPSVSGEVKTYKKLLKKKRGIKYKVNRNMPYYGQSDHDKKTIEVNTKKGELVNTIIHEQLHIKHPKMKEKNIRKRADIMERNMPVHKQIGLLKKISRKRNG